MRRGDDLGSEGHRDPDGPIPEAPTRSGLTPKQVLIGVLAVLLVAFAALNFKPVRVNFLVFQTQARVVTVIAVAGILGFVIGYFVGRPGREERRRLRKPDGD